MESTPPADVEPPLREKLCARNVCFRYGDTLALEQVTFPVYEHRVTALIGPSGCGKSTLLRIFNRLFELYPDQHCQGEALLDGENQMGREIPADRVRRRIGMVFQTPTPFPMSIWENVAFGPQLYCAGARRQLDAIVEDALRRAALWDEVKSILHRSALALSGGQQQRLCIARALAIRPEVILMDEPCSALDPGSTAKIEATIGELKAGHTIIIVSHNLEQAARVSDFAAFMYLGRLVEFGPSEQIFTAPRHEQTRRFIAGRFG